MSHPRGSFGYATVIGTTAGHWAPDEYRKPIMGCPVAGQHVWGALRTEAGRSLAIRHFINEAAVRFISYDEGAGGDFTFGGAPGFAGLCDVTSVDGEWGIVAPGRPPRFRFTTSPRAGRWVERDVLDLAIVPEGQALQFATPDADEPLAYLARMFRVSDGSYLGRRVTDGYVFHEQVYLQSGHGWVLSVHKRRLQGVWLVFVTRYRDGRVDWGQICYGTRGWSFAVVIRSDGDPILAHRPAGQVDLADDGYPRRATFDLGGGEVWKWNPPASGGGRIDLPGPPETTPRWAEGVVTPLGHTAEVEFGHTWWESYAGHLDT